MWFWVSWVRAPHRTPTDEEGCRFTAAFLRVGVRCGACLPHALLRRLSLPGSPTCAEVSFLRTPPQPSTFIVISGAGRASYDSHQARNRRLRAMNAPVAGLQTLDGRVSGPGRPFLFLTHDVWGDKKPYLYAGFWRRWSYMSGQLPWALKAGVRKKTANGLSRKGRGY